MQAGIHRYAGNTICLSAARAKLIFNTLFRAIKLRRPPISLSITVGSPCGARFPRIGITVAETSAALIWRRVHSVKRNFTEINHADSWAIPACPGVEENLEERMKSRIERSVMTTLCMGIMFCLTAVVTLAQNCPTCPSIPTQVIQTVPAQPCAAKNCPKQTCQPCQTVQAQPCAAKTCPKQTCQPCQTVQVQPCPCPTCPCPGSSNSPGSDATAKSQPEPDSKPEPQPEIAPAPPEPPAPTPVEEVTPIPTEPPAPTPVIEITVVEQTPAEAHPTTTTHKATKRHRAHHKRHRAHKMKL